MVDSSGSTIEAGQRDGTGGVVMAQVFFYKVGAMGLGLAIEW